MRIFDELKLDGEEEHLNKAEFRSAVWVFFIVLAFMIVPTIVFG